MKIVKLLIILLAILGLAVVVAVLSGPVYGAFKNGYTKKEMDWNEDGVTTFREFLKSADVGRRHVENDEEKSCIEYFSLKDGLVVKMICAK